MTPKRLLYTPKILSDLPIIKAEGAAFNFNDFTHTLARLIAAKETETPLVIGVSGSWGSGKTSLLKRLQDSLKQTEVLNDPSKPALIDFVNEDEAPQAQFRACKTVWFNAWKYVDEDELLVALVRVITQAMFADGFISYNAAALLEPFTPRRDVINTVLSWFSIKVGNVEFGPNTGQPQPTPFAEKTAMLDLFDEAFDKLLAAWVHQSLDVTKIDSTRGALVVFIDDLDRCLPAKAVQVLEAVKLFLDKPGCVFVLGADTRVTQIAVTKYYSDAGVTGENASDYLEKIIQLRFDLPPVLDAEMGRYVEMQSGDPELARHWQVISAGAELNPRKVKTFLNDINLAWALLRNMDKAHDAVKDDFVRWQALMRAAPEGFKRKIFDIDDLELRFNYVRDALTWAKGGEEATPLEVYFEEYAKTPRLRRTLRAIGAFTGIFDAQALDDFLHLSAPPPKVVEKAQETVTEPALQEQPEDFANVEREAILETMATRSGKEPVRPPMDGRFVTVAGIDFVKILAGKFLMGSKEAYNDEKPQHTIDIPYDYWLARFPLTNEQYSAFAQASGGKHPISSWEKKKDHPLVLVSWQDAQVYVKWLNDEYAADLPKGYVYRLPSEAEWEKAARGAYGNIYPWGNEFDKNKCHSAEGGKRDTTPVGAYSPAGDSSYGCADMVGNVWEWTHSLFEKYPYRAQDGRENEQKTGDRVLRGGSFRNSRLLVRCAGRGRYNSDSRFNNLGFRVSLAPAFDSRL